jgi:hypothetical protein
MLLSCAVTTGWCAQIARFWWVSAMFASKSNCLKSLHQQQLALVLFHGRLKDSSSTPAADLCPPTEAWCSCSLAHDRQQDVSTSSACCMAA